MPSTFIRFPGPLAEKHPQSIILAPPRLTAGAVFSGSMPQLFPLTKAMSLCPKAPFLSSNHKIDNQKLRSFSKCDFAKARRACVCLCFKSGVFCGLHPRNPPPQRNPPLCNVRWSVSLDSVVPDSLRLFRRALIVIHGLLLASRRTRFPTSPSKVAYKVKTSCTF